MIGMSAVNSKKTYLVWLDALTEDQLTIVAAIEKYFAREQGIDAPKGLKEWKTFVTAVVDMYERTLSTLAEVAEEEAAAMAVADAEREKTFAEDAASDIDDQAAVETRLRAADDMARFAAAFVDMFVLAGPESLHWGSSVRLGSKRKPSLRKRRGWK